jgi:hypothetical protein
MLFLHREDAQKQVGRLNFGPDEKVRMKTVRIIKVFFNPN